MPPGAERREEADKAVSRTSQKKDPQSKYQIPSKRRRIHDFEKNHVSRGASVFVALRRDKGRASPTRLAKYLAARRTGPLPGDF